MPAGRFARCVTAADCIVEKNRPTAIDTSATLKGNFAWHITRAFTSPGAASAATPAFAGLPGRNRPAAAQPVAWPRPRKRRFPFARESTPPRSRSLGPTRKMTRRTSSDEPRHFRRGLVRLIDARHHRRQAGDWTAASEVGVISPKVCHCLPGKQCRRDDGHCFSEAVGANRCSYRHGGGPLLWDEAIRPANSIKEAVFPRHENLFAYHFAGSRSSCPPSSRSRRTDRRWRGPCDAAALSILDQVFNWGKADPFYARRRERTTVVTLACRVHDADAFANPSAWGQTFARVGRDVVLDRETAQF